MANEATIQSSLILTKTSSSVRVLDYSSRPQSYSATVTGSKGPSPGAVDISTSGTSIDLSELDWPSLCRFMNQDATNRVEVGVYNGVDTFFPFLELLPGEFAVVRLSRYLQGPGTAGTYELRGTAYGATVSLLVEAFEY